MYYCVFYCKVKISIRTRFYPLVVTVRGSDMYVVFDKISRNSEHLLGNYIFIIDILDRYK